MSRDSLAHALVSAGSQGIVSTYLTWDGALAPKRLVCCGATGVAAKFLSMTRNMHIFWQGLQRISGPHTGFLTSCLAKSHMEGHIFCARWIVR